MSEDRGLSTGITATGAPPSAGWLPLFVLCVFTLLASANAVHDTLIFDDKAFVGSNATSSLEHFGDAFSRDLWGHARSGSGLYRPLLLIGLEIENRVFGDWARGYHAVNVLLHLAVTLSLFGFLAMLVRRSGITGQTAWLVALLASLVFAVHPVHAEVVNSVFNRSSMIVALGTIVGLWWLLRHVEAHPLRAWLGFGAVYSVTIFFKESALVMPGLAVALIVILGPGSLTQRVRRFLPVFWLLIPIAVYFYLRATALVADVPSDLAGDAMPSQFSQMIAATDLPNPGRLLSVLGVTGMGLELFVWPHPLKLVYELPIGGELVFVIVLQLALIALALVLLARGRPAFAAGLAIYYVAMIPASRLLSMDGSYPHLSDRYLYVPSIGLALVVAALFALALRSRWRKPAVLAGLSAIVLLAIVNWQRNSEWQSQAVLFETDYANGHRSTFMVRMLIGEHGNENRFGRVTELCELHPEAMEAYGQIAMRCGVAMVNSRQKEQGIAALEIAAESADAWLQADMLLANIHSLERRPQAAAARYARIIEKMELPEQKEVYRGIALVRVWPEDRQKLLQARAHFERALELSPGLEAAIEWRDHVDGLLEPAGAAAQGDEPTPQ